MTSMKSITVSLFALFALLASGILHFGTMFVMAMALLFVPFISYLIGRRSIRGMECSRDVPEFGHEDEPISVTVRVKVKKGILGAVELDDHLPQWLNRPTEEFHDISAMEAEGAVITYTIIARKRGEYEIGPLGLEVTDPLGFFRFSVIRHLKSHILILPRPLDIPELQIKPTGQTGEHHYEGTGAKGSGLDFHSVREYSPGDELRRVHWPSTARHGKLNVIEFEHTKVEDAVIAVDLQRGTEIGAGRYTTLEYAVSIAAALSEQALSMGSMVRLACQGVNGVAAHPARGLGHWYSMLEALAKVEATSPLPISEVIAGQSGMFAENAALICLGSTISRDLIMYAELLTRNGTRMQYILVKLPGQLTEDEMLGISGLASAGASVIVVEGSTTAFEGRITYEYAG